MADTRLSALAAATALDSALIYTVRGGISYKAASDDVIRPFARARVVATANVAIATGLENGDTIDGVTLATGDAVLLTGQTAPAENGLYTVPASGAAARKIGFTSYDEHPGVYFAVMEGTAKADTLWRCTSNKGGTLGSTSLTFGEYGREKLAAARTYYVRTDGSDSNAGLANTAAGAFLTVQKAVDTIIGSLDVGGYTVTIQVADGTYSGAIDFPSGWTGGGSIVIAGNAGTPANVHFSRSGTILTTNGALPGPLTIQSCKLTATGSTCIYHQATGVVRWNNVEFGASTYHVRVKGSGARAEATGNYSIVGSATFHLMCQYGCNVSIVGRTVTLTGTPAWASAFAYADLCSGVDLQANTFTGSATGSRYISSALSFIYVAGAGITYLPGSTAGSLLNGGLYA